MKELSPEYLRIPSKLRRDRVFEVVEEKLKRASALKCWKEA
jgi:hypothetical protein